MTHIDLENDNPKTLIGTKCDDLIIFGLSLNMTLDEVKKALSQDKRLHFIYDDSYGSHEIRVYEKNTDNLLLLCLWDKNMKKLVSISIFHSCHNYLTVNFQKLLTKEVVCKNSKFSLEFLSDQTREPEIRESQIKSLQKTIIYYFEDVGINIFEKYYIDRIEYVFVICPKLENLD